MEKTIRRETPFQGTLINIRVDEVLLTNGKRSKREIVEHRGAVAILPVKDEEILFVKQYRKAIEDDLLEVPAGTWEVGETIEETARRELLEELGYRAHQLKRLSSFYTSPGYSTEEIHLFLAKDLRPVEGFYPDDDEDLQMVAMHEGKVKDLLFQGFFKDGKTITALALYFLNQGEAQ